MFEIKKLRNKDFEIMNKHSKRDRLVLPSTRGFGEFNVLSDPKDIKYWKQEFIENFGNKGVLEYNQSHWEIKDNEDYTMTHESYLEATHNWLKKNK